MVYLNMVFAFYYPKMYASYSDCMKELCLHKGGEEFAPPFYDTLFAAQATNLGPSIYTFLHEDFLNLVYGICTVTALGTFDYTKGGHLYLSQLGYAIQFPPGCTFLLPSAALTHGNVPIAKTEVWASIVHYTAAGLFWWVAYGNMTMKQAKVANKGLYDQRQAECAQRAQAGLDMFSKVEELFKDQDAVFRK